MEIVSSDKDLKRYITTAVEVDPEKPVLVDKYLNNATELDVDALCDKDGNVVIAGIMEHIEQAGVHSGDSACSIPTQTIPESSRDHPRLDLEGCQAPWRRWPNQHPVRCDSRRHGLHHRGKPPRFPHRPFVAKAIGHPLAKYASLVMSGKTLKEVGFTEEVDLKHVAVKEAVLSPTSSPAPIPCLP